MLNAVVRFIFSSSLQIWYVEVQISRSILDSPLEFEITRVDCTVILEMHLPLPLSLSLSLSLSLIVSLCLPVSLSLSIVFSQIYKYYICKGQPLWHTYRSYVFGHLITVLVLKLERLIYYLFICLGIAGWVENSLDPDQTPRFAASDLGLHCLFRPVCPNI